jgi:predicted TIM-barrel fold metal-dependent hydrolase
MGPLAPPFKSEGGHVSTLLRVLVDFPDLTVIAAHLGLQFWQDLIALGKVRENLMCDFSGVHGRLIRGDGGDYSQFCYMLRKFLDEFGRERVMFGTDAAFLEYWVSSKEQIEKIRGLPHESPELYAFTEEEVSAILDGNARRLLASIPQKPV